MMALKDKGFRDTRRCKEIDQEWDKLLKDQQKRIDAMKIELLIRDACFDRDETIKSLKETIAELEKKIDGLNDALIDGMGEDA